MNATPNCTGPSPWSQRRSFIGGGLGAALASRIINWQALAAEQSLPGATPMSCILLWMNGGPSHLETFDPKPNSKSGGPHKTISTRQKQLSINEHLPHIAEQADKLAVIRSMTSKEGNHDRGRYLMHTGYAPSVTLQHPSFGSWISQQLTGERSDLPHFVCIRGGAVGAGFLGVEHAPLTVQDPEKGLNNLHLAKNVDLDRFRQRQLGLEILQKQFQAATGAAHVDDLNSVYRKAQHLMSSPLAQAFDLSGEPTAIRDAYGRTAFGQGCLMARRLIESGVRCVEVTLDGWDTHVDNFTQTANLCNELDPAYGTLLQELAQRDLLRRTLVIWMGEFGRSPEISKVDGRDHHPHAWSAVLAGGRVRAGQVYGATDETGAKVVTSPIAVPDYFATLATLMGIDPAAEAMSPVGRPIAVSDKGTAIKALIA